MPDPTPEDLATCLRVLQELARHDGADTDTNTETDLDHAILALYQRGKKRRRRERRAATTAADRAAIEQTARVASYRDGASVRAPSVQGVSFDSGSSGAPQSVPVDELPRLHRERRCYVCNAAFTMLHPHYHMMCPPCAAQNWHARHDRVDLRGRRAIVTGGRIKIGFEVATKLLRDGATVIVTTRFAHDAAHRFAAEPDFATFADRLAIHTLDLRYVPAVIAWTDRLVRAGEPFDILVNNAAQTVRRPDAYYADLLRASPALPPAARALLADPGAIHAAPATDRVDQLELLSSLFPIGRYDEEGRQLDLRATNSWVTSLADVEPIEAIETLLVNAIGPLLLASRLRPLLIASPHADRHVVNASAMEGKFDRHDRQSTHPHTNMAKAALNMLTATSHADYASDGIYMNSVDTGWITQENPHPIKTRVEAAGFVPPLDVVDGAARIYAPILAGIRGAPVHGLFLKDYTPTTW